MLDCHSCRLNAAVDALPPWERAYLTDDWRLAHASASLRGYMVLSPRRHLLALDELAAAEAVALGPLLAATTGALRAVVGCSKTYVLLFAERRGWEHVHFHVVPRMPDFSERHVGPGALEFLKVPEEEWVPPGERARLAAEIGALVGKGLADPRGRAFPS